MGRIPSLLGADAYTALAETNDNGYPVLEHVKRAGQRRDHLGPGHCRRFRADHRGGDFDLHIGQDISIGYLSHTDKVVRLYLQETLTLPLVDGGGRRRTGAGGHEVSRTARVSRARRAAGRRPPLCRR